VPEGPSTYRGFRVRRTGTRIAGLATCVALVATSCAANSEPTASTGTQSATTTAISSAPTHSALKAIDPAAFRAVVEDATKRMMVPGAVVVLRTPQGNFETAVGTTELGRQTPPDADTHFRIASNTKTMTAALVVLLAQDGKLQFTDPVSKYVPNVPNGNNITVAELLKMRSGLYGYTDAPELSAALDADPAKAWTPQDVLAIAFRHPPQFAPDASYEYSNTNYALLGLIAEKVGGRPLRDQLQDRLFGPLGLAATSLPATDDTSMPAPYSHGYMYGGTFYALADEEYPADMQAAARAGTLQPVDYTNQNPSYATGAGGAISTADNLATWIRALTSGKVFDADHQQQWLTSVQAEDPDQPDGQKYGYGISYQRFSPTAAMYYHGGELPGFNSFMGYDPDNDVTLVIWTNLTLSPDGKTTTQAMLPTLLDEIYTGLSLAPAPTPTTTR
jgi:CubicO group peptidase (beta-lactamase class C family)